MTESEKFRRFQLDAIGSFIDGILQDEKGVEYFVILAAPDGNGGAHVNSMGSMNVTNLISLLGAVAGQAASKGMETLEGEKIDDDTN